MLKDLLASPDSPWTQAEGPERDVVMSSRIRLARNFKAQPFPNKEQTSSAMHVWKYTSDFAQDQGDPLHFYSLKDEAPLDRQVLVEKHLISPQQAHTEDAHRALVLSDDFSISIMVNEEDHIRLQVFAPGLDLAPAYEKAAGLEKALGHQADYAFHSRWGYLTACPTNMGTGLRASALLHLPALAKTQGDSFLKSLPPMGLTARGLYGEGSKAYGDFYQISNQRTLGIREEDILASLNQVCNHLIEGERQARKGLKDQGLLFEDYVFRSYGLLRHSRHMALEEAFERLSYVRLGLAEGLFPGSQPQDLDPIYVAIQPASIQKSLGQNLDQEGLDRTRADLLRQAMAQLKS